MARRAGNHDASSADAASTAATALRVHGSAADTSHQTHHEQ